MNDKQLQKFTAFACFAFAVFCLLWVTFNYVLLPVSEGQKDYTLLVKDSGWIYTTLAGLLSSIFGIFAVIGIYFTNRNTGGIILFTGFVLLLLGLALEMSSLTWDTFVWPVLCADDNHISFVKEGIFIKSLQFIIFIIALLFFLTAGNILFSIGLIKTKKFGKIIPLLLIIGILLYVTGNLIIIHIASLGLCIYCIAYVLMGLRLLKEQK